MKEKNIINLITEEDLGSELLHGIKTRRLEQKHLYTDQIFEGPRL